MQPSSTKVSVVVPVYRSEGSLEPLVSRLVALFKNRPGAFEIILVDDASQDNSWHVLEKLKDNFGSTLKIVRLLMNCGQHNALLCGFSLVSGEVVVTMDDDLQNPPEEIPKLLDAIDRGYDLVIGAYATKEQSRFRNFGGRLVDATIRRIFGLPRTFQLTSFRAARRYIVDHACRMSGAFPYVTCMLLASSPKSVNVSVRHDPRLIGCSNYTLKRSVLLAANLLFSYSPYPLYFVAVVCGAAILGSIGYGMLTLYRALHYGTSVPGWASLMVVTLFFHGLIVLCLFVLGIYLARLTQQATGIRSSFTIRDLRE
jgi:glycosyltransferase involved in cell wall biosynthesis